MSEIINETINELNKPTQNNVFSIEDNPVTVLEKINQVERYLKQIDTSVDTSINTANEALDKANNAFEANGTLVKINGENQLTWSADFAESERQKSKNLIPYPYYDGNSFVSNGITFTVNNDQSISVSGSIIDHNSNAVMWLALDMPLKAGTYRISDNSSDNDLGVVANIGDSYYSGEFTLSSDATANIYLQVGKGSTKTYNDTIKFMLCEGTDTDWQPYNGAIVHEKDIEPVLIYDKDTKNTIGGTAYTDGIPINNTNISNDFSSYKKVEVIGSNRNVPIISTIDLTLHTNDTYYYGSGGLSYNAPIGEYNQYYLFMTCAISLDKTQLVLFKAGYGDTVETTQKVIRIVGYK